MNPAFVVNAEVDLAVLIEEAFEASNSPVPNVIENCLLASDTVPVHPAPPSTWDGLDVAGGDDCSSLTETGGALAGEVIEYIPDGASNDEYRETVDQAEERQVPCKTEGKTRGDESKQRAF